MGYLRAFLAATVTALVLGGCSNQADDEGFVLNSFKHREAAQNYFKGHGEGVAKASGGELSYMDTEITAVFDTRHLALKTSWATTSPRLVSVDDGDENLKRAKAWEARICTSSLRTEMAKMGVSLFSAEITNPAGRTHRIAQCLAKH